MIELSKKRTEGFTLVETLVALGIFSLIALGISQFSHDTFDYSRNLQQSLTAQQNAGMVLRQMASALRTASQSSTGTFALATVGANDLKFYSDTNGDGTKEEIRYYLSADGKSIMKDVRVPTGSPLQYTGQPVTTTEITSLVNGNTPIFQYYDTNYDGTTAALTQPVNITAVRLIKVTAIIDVDPAHSPTPIIASTQVTLRNLKDNL